MSEQARRREGKETEARPVPQRTQRGPSQYTHAHARGLAHVWVEPAHRPHHRTSRGQVRRVLREVHVDVIAFQFRKVSVSPQWEVRRARARGLAGARPPDARRTLARALSG